MTLSASEVTRTLAVSAEVATGVIPFDPDDPRFDADAHPVDRAIGATAMGSASRDPRRSILGIFSGYPSSQA